jgi:hypothetical protein
MSWDLRRLSWAWVGHWGVNLRGSGAAGGWPANTASLARTRRSGRLWCLGGEAAGPRSLWILLEWRLLRWWRWGRRGALNGRGSWSHLVLRRRLFLRRRRRRRSKAGLTALA